MRMLVMAAHEMRSLGVTVTGTVDATYAAPDLCDGDPATPVRVDGGSLSLGIPLLAGSVDGLVVVNHNLDNATTVAFSGLGDVITGPVPPGDIRRNAYTRLTTPAAGGGTTTVTATRSGALVIGEVFVGLFREVWPLPTETALPWNGVQVKADGEYHRLSYSMGAQGFGPFGGTLVLLDDDYEILRDAYLASRENSLPTVIVILDDPSFDASDPLVVTWESFIPKPVCEGIWFVEVSWRELPRYRWPEVA